MSKTSYDITIIMAPMWNVREPWTAPAYLCETLRNAGYRVQFLDYNVRLFRWCERVGYGHLWQDDAYFKVWNSGDLEFLVHLIDLDEIQGEIVGFSTTHANVRCSIALAKLVRERFPKKRILFGGHQVFFPEHVADVPADVADAVCKGEGEQTLLEVMERGCNRLDDIPGLYLPSGDSWRLIAERPVIRDLDTIPWPRFEEVDLAHYEKRFLPLVGSRGCISRCVFCTDRCRAPGFRTRSAMNQVDELEHLSDRFNVDHFPYNDSLLNGNIHLLEAKTDEILRRGLDVRYGGNLMVRDGMPQELFQKLARSGFRVALIGVESGSATTLWNMRKAHTPEQAEAFVRKCHEAGIRTELNFIVGFPTETEEHFEETLDFLRRNCRYIDTIISATTFCLAPSEIWDRRESFHIVVGDSPSPQDWSVRDGTNTLEIRLHRLERFLALARELDIMSDTVYSDSNIQRAYERVTPGTFIEGASRYWESRKQEAPMEYAEALAAMGRVRAALPRRGSRTVELAGKAFSSLRQRGIRQTLRRAGEWARLHRR